MEAETKEDTLSIYIDELDIDVGIDIFKQICVCGSPVVRWLLLSDESGYARCESTVSQSTSINWDKDIDIGIEIDGSPVVRCGCRRGRAPAGTAPPPTSRPPLHTTHKREHRSTQGIRDEHTHEHTRIQTQATISLMLSQCGRLGCG
jgi:hypothetical protein